MVRHMVNRLAAAVAVAALLASGVARAADMPIKAPAAIAPSGGFYFWADGSYQSLRLPTVNLGQTHLVFPPGGPANANAGPIATFDPRVTGAGGTAAIGYVFPTGTLPSAFGSNVRLELAGFYMNATADQNSQTNLSSPALSGTAAFQHVNGNLSFFLICGADPCPTNTSLHTRYDSFRIDLRAASDFNMGALRLSPSLAIFAGRTRNEQSLQQNVDFVTIVVPTLTLSESASEKSNDVGAKIGLKAKYDVTRQVALGIGGDMGFAVRRILLDASDNSSGSATKATYSTSGTVTAFVARAEGDLIVRVAPNTSLTLFGGLTYDSHVAGIAAQNYTGVLFGGVTSTTPVSIRTAPEFGYFTGLRLTVGLGQ